MKIKKLTAWVAIGCALFVGAANADILVKTHALSNVDSCDSIPGTWLGNGNAVTDMLA